ncbi:hypothetical protein [Streptomyces sp. NPDC002250]|uniref:hypothetical protein n=1 Tax=Streptomyces sp. NPDC002250 TaxID=3364641 RepID=UPI0036A17652
MGSVAFSPDGRLLMAGSDDRTARMWRVSPGAGGLIGLAVLKQGRLFAPTVVASSALGGLRCTDGAHRTIGDCGSLRLLRRTWPGPEQADGDTRDGYFANYRCVVACFRRLGTGAGTGAFCR